MTRGWFARRVAGPMAGIALTAVSLFAHPMTYSGTVLAVEPARIQVNAIDPMTKKEGPIWFVVSKDTKVQRGDKEVAYTDAGIEKDERIVVIVDMDASTKNLAEQIRLAVK